MKQDFSETLALEGMQGTIASGQTFPWGMVEKEVQPVRVLFLCTGNSCRSQMAEALLRRAVPTPVVEVASAGTDPKPMHPNVILAMREIDVDISAQRSKSLQPFPEQDFDYAITLCDDAQGRCPSFPGTARHLHWPLTDPAATEGTEEERLEAFRSVRNELSVRIEGLFPEIFERLLERTYSDQS